ncbi:MAG TPA: hydrogen peroxide-inducible genes activator, partial [Sphingopyxis sp.]|nr:hydrogen peroxide-inducible genes activator [Sphingopyxis sp.]
SEHDWRTIALVWRKGSPRAEEFRMLADIFRQHRGD